MALGYIESVWLAPPSLPILARPGAIFVSDWETRAYAAALAKSVPETDLIIAKRGAVSVGRERCRRLQVRVLGGPE